MQTAALWDASCLGRYTIADDGGQRAAAAVLLNVYRDARTRNTPGRRCTADRTVSPASRTRERIFDSEQHAEDPQAVRVKKLIHDHYHDHAWRYAAKENFSDVKHRALKAIRYLEKIDKENVLVVSHGAFVRALVSAMAFGPELKSAEKQTLQHFMRLNNTGIAVCKYENEKWELLAWNDRAHLG